MKTMNRSMLLLLPGLALMVLGVISNPVFISVGFYMNVFVVGTYVVVQVLGRLFNYFMPDEYENQDDETGNMEDHK